MIPKSCRLFGQDHATDQILRAKSRFNVKRFRRAGICPPRLRGEKWDIEKVRLGHAGAPAVTLLEKRIPFSIGRTIE
jgi:hypothetical protein